MTKEFRGCPKAHRSSIGPIQLFTEIAGGVVVEADGLGFCVVGAVVQVHFHVTEERDQLDETVCPARIHEMKTGDRQTDGLRRA
jgi:hypothetical protein